MAKTRSRGSVTGFAALGLVAVGVYLGSKMDLAGPGSDGEGQAAQTTISTSTEGEPVESVAPVDLPEQNEPDVAPLGPPPIINVQIREDEFLVTRGDAEAAGAIAMALPEIADLAATTTGTAEGIRVRIERHTSARAGDQQRLYQALTGVGVRPEAMQQMSGFVE